MKRSGFLLVILASAILSACRQKTASNEVYGVNHPSFKKVAGVNFLEVRRAFNTGLIFDSAGYKMEPSFKLSFLSDDSVSVYNPGNKRFSTYKIYYDQDSIINMARIWFKPKIITRDSLILRLLKVGEDSVLRMKKSVVYMTFYSDKYIKTLPAWRLEQIKAPHRKDTIFIKTRAANAGVNPDSAFGALEPVQLTSRSPAVKVKKVLAVTDAVAGTDASINYLLPEFTITINKAYDNFFHSFFIVVDDGGKMHFLKSGTVLSPDVEENYIKIMKGIMDGYLTHYLIVKPGTTLGIPHSSIIYVHVDGRK